MTAALQSSRKQFGPESEVIALCGGVGGAKLALGLQRVVEQRLTVIVNVGDDFEHLGLRICPDLDTVLYTLSGLNDHDRGWGRAGETWHFMEALELVGGDTWFRLGDRDLALHVERTRRLRNAECLTDVVGDLAKRLGIAAQILPATDDHLRTMVLTSSGQLEFQRYFVEQRCEPQIDDIVFNGASRARVTDPVAKAMSSKNLAAIVLCPSNPYLSIDPILSIPPLRKLIEGRQVPAIAVSPIIGGRAVKGPTAKIMRELGVEANSKAIARHYATLIDGLVVDVADAASAHGLDVPVLVTNTLMTDVTVKTRLATDVLNFAVQLCCSVVTKPSLPQKAVMN